MAVGFEVAREDYIQNRRAYRLNHTAARRLCFPARIRAS